MVSELPGSSGGSSPVHFLLVREKTKRAMGNARSEFHEQVNVDPWWNDDRTATTSKKFTEIEQFRQRRSKIISEKKKEMDDLRQELERYKSENERLQEMLTKQRNRCVHVNASQQTDVFEVPGRPDNYDDFKSKIEEMQIELSNLESARDRNRDLQKNIVESQKELQRLNFELISFESERQEYKTHVAALKNIITVSKQLLLIKDNEVKELNQKVTEIQATVAQKSATVFADGHLREEYEKQLKNMKYLRALYEERQQSDKVEKEKLKRQLDEANATNTTYEERNGELQTRVDELEKENDQKTDLVFSLQSQLGLAKADCGELRAEMTVINQLFSQILYDFNNGQEVDLDKLIKILEENHGLLTEIVVNEESNEISSALPKVLLDLVNQVKKSEEKICTATPTTTTTTDECEATQPSAQQSSLSSASEIVENLPKVWRVLIELLSHQTPPANDLNNRDGQNDNPCYKAVQTPAGPTMVLSVSQTYIRLKNLILEKKALEKETTRLKQLNTHLETRLQDQEKRLEMVSDELSKTWHVVGKMQKQHQLLHTQEKILRYELAQKRKLLNELKEELEYCREKWLQAREKNFTTEEQWKQLRTEFAARKAIKEDVNNSAESGYSDERESSSSDEEFERRDRGILKVIQEEIATIEDAEAVTSAKEPETDLILRNCDSKKTTGTSEFGNVPEPNSLRKDIDEMYKKLEEDILMTIKKTQNGEECPSISKRSRTTEEILLAREERLKRLEDESNQLIGKATRTSDRSIEICSKLDDLHQQYGEAGASTSTDREADNRNTSVGGGADEVLKRREQRLQRLEEEAKQVMGKAVKNSKRSHDICDKLSRLHDRYGESSGSSNDNGERSRTMTEKRGDDKESSEEK